jgi:cytochrome c oxidase assembly protein subunit 15
MTLCLIFVGGLVTSTASGLAVPDWPLSFGQVFPPMVGGVLFEHGHRMVAAFVGMLTVTLVVLYTRWEPRPWVRWLARGALGVVIVQGLLGGLTVLLRLPTAVSVTHACLAQTFLCLVVTLAVWTTPGWQAHEATLVTSASPSLHTLTRLATGMIFVQLLLGALMRHTGAGLAIPDFPLAFGRLIPPLTSPGVALHFLHRVGAVAVAAAIAWSVGRVFTTYRAEPLLRRPAVLLAVLLLAQLALGALTIWTQRGVIPMTAHVAVGAAVLSTSLILALRTSHLVRVPGRMYRRELVSKQVTA